MSQILDALKRSEAARTQATEAPVTAAPVWRATRRRVMWPVWSGLIVAGVLAAGAWQNRADLWPGQFAQTADEPPAEAASEPVVVPEATAAAPVVAAPLPAAPAPVAAETILPDPTAPASITELAPTPTIIQPGDVAVPAGALPPGNQVTGLATMAGRDMLPEPVSSPEPLAEPVQAAPTPVPAVVEPAQAAPTNAEPILPVYTDLPYSLRRDLPVLRFSTYRYHEDQGQRFVVYQERRVAEQGVLGQELWLREIHPDHLVLDFRGTLFTVPR